MDSAFVGRARELAVLRALLDGAQAGRGAVAWLIGEPGIGKTRTASALADEARGRGHQVLWGACHEAEGAPAFWPWVQVLRDAAARLSRTELEPFAAILAELVPEIGARVPDAPPPTALAPAQERFRLFDHVARLLTGPAVGAGLLIVLDDLHWADPASLRLLELLVGRLDSARVLVVGTFRPTELQPGHALAEIERLARVERIELRGLSAAEVAEYVDAVGARGLSPDDVHARTDGNPFFVGELARHGIGHSGVPSAIRDVIARRVARLPATCRAVLADAAVLGREFALDVLAAMADADAAAVAAALDEAESAGLVAGAGHLRWRFMHALVREALYEALDQTARRRAHVRAGEVLEALPGAPLELLAHHFAQALPEGDAGRAVEYGRRAAERGLRLLAYETATELFRLAFEAAALRRPVLQDERCELLLGVGEAQSRAGDTVRARLSFARAADLARATGDPQRLARAALGFAGTVVVARGASDPATVALLDEALAAHGADEDLLVCRLLSRLAMELVWDRARQAERETLSARAVALARRLGHPRAMGEALVARHYAIWAPETAAERLALAREVVAVADRSGDEELGLRGRRWLIVDLIEHGDAIGAEREVAACARTAVDLRQPLYHWVADAFRSIWAILAGDLEAAEAYAETALPAGRRAVGTIADVYHASQLIAIRREQDRLEEAEAMAARTVAQYPALAIFDCYRAALLAELGRREPAGDLLERLTRDELPRDALWLGAVAALADACAQLEAAGPARTLYRAAAGFGELMVAPAALVCPGSAQRPLGLLAATFGDRARALGHLRAAAAADARFGARGWEAWGRHEQARLLAADRSQALKLNSAALDAARALGLERLRGRAEALDGRLRQLRPAGLSRRELETLELLAAGRSNKEIAAALVVTVNTVERHLVSIYRKIGARRRADAAVFAHSNGLVKDSGFP